MTLPAKRYASALFTLAKEKGAADAVAADLAVLHGELHAPGAAAPSPAGAHTLTIVPKPGVTDPVAHSVQKALSDMDLPPVAAGTYRTYDVYGDVVTDQLLAVARKGLANDTVQQLKKKVLEAAFPRDDDGDGGFDDGEPGSGGSPPRPRAQGAIHHNNTALVIGDRRDGRDGRHCQNQSVLSSYMFPSCADGALRARLIFKRCEPRAVGGAARLERGVDPLVEGVRRVHRRHQASKAKGGKCRSGCGDAGEGAPLRVGD